MEMGMILLNQIIIMFGLMLIGALLFKKGFISNQGSKELGNILLYVSMPATIINSFLVPYTPERLDGILMSLFLAIIALALSMLVATIFFGKRNGIGNFAVAFANAGFIGIPLVQAALGNEAVFYIAPFVALLSVCQWTYGAYAITLDPKVIKLKSIIMVPTLWALLVGLIIFFLRISVPSIPATLISFSASLNTPVAMIVCGIYLAQTDLISMLKDKQLYIITLFRLIIVPAITIAIMSFIPGFHDVKIAVLISASGPVGTNIAVFAKLYDKDYTLAVKTVVFTTILSIILLPLVISVAAMIL